MIIMYENLEKHESYGKISIHRIQNGNAQRLFGSDVKHHNTIQIEIKQCSVDRHLNEEWYYGENILAEIELSPVQFAEAITNMNTEGVPCTIRYINGKNITPHKLRATYGTQLYNKTGDIYFVQQCMGHTNPKTTELYVRERKQNTKRASDIMDKLI